jgi:xanthine/uracil/vitamin C permease (AzgA family)
MKEAGTLAAIFFGMFLFGLAAGMPIVAVPAFGLALLFQVMASIGPPQKAKTRIR